MNPTETSADVTSSGGSGVLEMVGSSGLIVQLVLLMLIGFSVLTWAIIFFKWGAYKRCRRSTDRFLDFFWSGKSMDLIYTEAKRNSASAVAKIFQSGYIELQRLMEKAKQKNAPAKSGKPEPPASSIYNLERALRKASRDELLYLEGSLPFLATTGSTAPFIGLFGTVWGIMNAFQGIGAAGGANLAVIGQGISEALLATAVGLFAAIPAVMGYNFYIQKIRGFKAEMDSFSEDFLNIIKRNFLPG